MAGSPDYLGYAYAVTVAVGGLIGFLKAGSLPSLVSGLTFGAAVAFGAYQISTSGNHTVMLIGSGLLAGVMGLRFYNSHKFMPAGLVCILSAIILARSLLKVTGN